MATTSQIIANRRTKLVPSLACPEPGVYPEPAEGKGFTNGVYTELVEVNYQLIYAKQSQFPKGQNEIKLLFSKGLRI